MSVNRNNPAYDHTLQHVQRGPESAYQPAQHVEGGGWGVATDSFGYASGQGQESATLSHETIEWQQSDGCGQVSGDLDGMNWSHLSISNKPPEPEVLRWGQTHTTEPYFRPDEYPHADFGQSGAAFISHGSASLAYHDYYYVPEGHDHGSGEAETSQVIFDPQLGIGNPSYAQLYPVPVPAHMPYEGFSVPTAAQTLGGDTRASVQGDQSGGDNAQEVFRLTEHCHPGLASNLQHVRNRFRAPVPAPTGSQTRVNERFLQYIPEHERRAFWKQHQRYVGEKTDYAFVDRS